MLLFHFLTRHINAQAHHYQMYAVNHNIFPVHLNAVITLVTVPIETVGSTQSLWLKHLPSVPQEWIFFQNYLGFIQNQTQLCLFGIFFLHSREHF